MQFEEIPGLHEFKQSLVSSYRQNHIAHAQLFNGPLGGGGLAMAISFATYLLCENKGEQDSCGQCANCRKMDWLIHPDVHFIYPKPSFGKPSKYEDIQAKMMKKWRQFAKENTYAGIDDWISYNGDDNKNVLISKEDSKNIIRTASMKSFEGTFKILIIWYPEHMHPAAANGILKVLEEPPAQTIFLLVSYSYESLLATIRSRTQIFNIPPFSEELIRGHLVKKKQVQPDLAEKISRLANGSLGKAFYELEHSGGTAYEWFRSWMQSCLKGNYTAMVKASDEFHASPKPNQRNQLEFSLALIREAILGQVDDVSFVNRDGAEGEFIRKFGSFASADKLEAIYREINDSLNNLARNANSKITFLSLSIQCGRILKA